jgi:two-component system NarL family response regulator
MARHNLLTKRQNQVLRQIAMGKTDKEIAAVLGIAAGTVSIHVSSILTRLRVKSRAQAVFRWRGH